jgi:polyribonucleotide nucleotidyltransferase
VVSIKDFGAFIEIAPETDGLCHVSELSDQYVDRVTDVINMGDEVRVKVILVDDQGRIKLSRKAAMAEEGNTDAEPERVGAAAPAPARSRHDEVVEVDEVETIGNRRDDIDSGDRGGDRGPRREGDRGGSRGGDRGPRGGGGGGGGGDRGPRPSGGGGGGGERSRSGGGGDRGPRSGGGDRGPRPSGGGGGGGGGRGGPRRDAPAPRDGD